MKKLTIVTAVAALVATFGFSGGASAHSPGVCKKADTAPETHAACHLLLDDPAPPLTLGEICGGSLTDSTKIQKTIETGANKIDGPCSINIAGNDFSIQQATITVTGDLTIEDNTGGGSLRIVASTINVGGVLDIDLDDDNTSMVDGDVTILRNAGINVAEDGYIFISGRGINVRDNLLTSTVVVVVGLPGPSVLDITGSSEVSVKSNVISDFDEVTITSGTELFVNDNDFGDDTISVMLNPGADCHAMGNTATEEVECPEL